MAAGEAFEFCSVGRIVFGRGEFARAGELAGEMGRSALIVTNAGEPGDGGAVDRLAELLSTASVSCAFIRQRGEPTVEGVDAAVQMAREAECDVVIGFGGGSAIDAAKAVAGLLTNGGSAIDYMEVVGEGRKITKAAAPWIAIPTTAGTGAEVTKNAVVTCEAERFKASIRSELLLARAVVVDAELGVPVRPDVTARAGMDALCQVIESYTSIRSQPITDALAAKGIALAARSLRRVYADGADVDAREDMAVAALLSGITLTNVGLGAVHGFASPLGANFPIPHGAVCGALLPHVIAANVVGLREESTDHPALARYAEIGRTLTGEATLPDSEAIDAGVAWLAESACELGIPPLGQFGLTAEDIPQMVALAGKSSSMRYNPVKLSEQVLVDVLTRAM
jgi:alcohol dehydrogenase class IV